MKFTHLMIITFIAFNAKSNILIKNSNVTDITIYRSYAKETRLGSTSIPAGNSEIIITNITQNIDINSIQVGCKNNVKILSVSSRVNYLTNENLVNTSNIKIWQDSLKLLSKKSRFKAKQKEAYEVELSVLNNNNKLGGNIDGLKPSLLKELLDLNRLKQAELKKLIFELDEDTEEIKNSLVQLESQISESNLNKQGLPVREIVLKVYSKNETNTQFKISYLVTSASWAPTYELRCENTTKPLQLSCRAKITQNTGFDWKNVRIKLSTANPNLNHNRPILYPIYVDFLQPDYYKNQLSKNKYNSYNSISSERAGASVNVQMMSSNMAYAKDDDFNDGLKVDKNAVIIAEGDMMVEYEIQDNQDIESDGQEHIIAIQEINLPAHYNYHSVPKLENAVFLLAQITDWGKYNLLAGDATIFFDDMYIGKSYLNPNINSDTLLISLGRDEKLNIKRVKLNELCITKKFSNKKKETKVYESTIKNNKNISVEIEILDQYPISSNSEIEVSLDEAEGAQVSKDYGKVLWRIKLQPGESKKLRLSYTLKFPDDKVVAEGNQSGK